MGQQKGGGVGKPIPRLKISGLIPQSAIRNPQSNGPWLKIPFMKNNAPKVSYHDPYVPIVRPTREHAQWTGIKSVPLGPRHDFQLRPRPCRYPPLVC